jgi:molybdopterin/thiamine biosynthesis adenylyltransferase/proteasome lid subunit RPN8/RPN11
MTRSVYREIERTIGHLAAEHGGALGWRENDRTVRFFRFDETARNTGATYSPDDRALNAMFRKHWNPRGIRLAGFVHSHPRGFTRPSGGDLAYAERILAAIPDLPYLVLPIVQTVPDTGKFRLIPFLVVRDGDTVRDERVELDLIADGTPEVVTPDETFERVKGAYDLDRMARARVFSVGVGGAASFIEDLARCGVGQFVLVDPDEVSETNIATQQVYRKDIGRPKVSALADRLRDINPRVQVREINETLDNLDDSAVSGLCRKPLAAGSQEPLATLLCGLTDNFYAQARVNALALHLGLPSLCAQVYREGRGAEVTFTYPGLTPACHRCILARRYEAFAEGFKNDVTSDGTPIFATSRLNAIKGYIALCLLHYRDDRAAGDRRDRFADLAARIGNRNLVQIRMDPDLADTVGIKTFDKVFKGSDLGSLFFDEAVWRPQDPESGQDGGTRCPDCGGTGDLRTSMGSFADTRESLRGIRSGEE